MGLTIKFHLKISDSKSLNDALNKYTEEYYTYLMTQIKEYFRCVFTKINEKKMNLVVDMIAKDERYNLDLQTATQFESNKKLEVYFRTIINLADAFQYEIISK